MLHRMANSNLTVEQLNKTFAIPGIAKFEPGEGGLPRLYIASPLATAELYLHGGHVTRFQPTGHSPLLWVSGSSLFADGKAIRGGVPVIFPWFGGKAGDPSAPAHGLVRSRSWNFHSLKQLPSDEVQAVLTFNGSLAENPLWGSDCLVTYTITVGTKLRLALAVQNRGPGPMTCEQALHTYFTVGDVRLVSVTGLAGAAYIDKVDGNSRKLQDGAPIKITGETDRVYLDTPAACTVIDPKLGRRITVEKTGSLSTVVWNPWIEKAKKMADFGDEEWPSMICVETANAGENAVTVAPGATHTLAATIGAEKI
jgi:glucose-6-phosphate 1-epimerase